MFQKLLLKEDFFCGGCDYLSPNLWREAREGRLFTIPLVRICKSSIQICKRSFGGVVIASLFMVSILDFEFLNIFQ